MTVVQIIMTIGMDVLRGSKATANEFFLVT